MTSGALPNAEFQLSSFVHDPTEVEELAIVRDPRGILFQGLAASDIIDHAKIRRADLDDIKFVEDTPARLDPAVARASLSHLQQFEREQN
jgi:hypothetical protein